jgi:hypothetical protein
VYLALKQLSIHVELAQNLHLPTPISRGLLSQSVTTPHVFWCEHQLRTGIILDLNLVLVCRSNPLTPCDDGLFVFGVSIRPGETVCLTQAFLVCLILVFSVFE